MSAQNADFVALLRHHQTWDTVAEAIGEHGYQYDLSDTSERIDVVQIVLTSLARVMERTDGR